MLKVNYIDDPDIVLGYPLIQLKGKYGKDKIEIFPIPELLSYEAFLTQLNFQVHFADVFFYGGTALKSANNEYYNNWLPIYINKEHYQKNKNTIFNSFNNIMTGRIPLYNIINDGNYNPDLIFKVLPMVLNSMIIGLFNGKRSCSSSFIRCYFQYILLFKKLCEEYEADYLDYLNTKFQEIKKNNYIVNKKIIPDIGNFFILLIFCNFDTKGEKMKKIYNSLYEDSLVRQMFWMFHSDENKDNMKRKMMANISNDTCLKKFKEDPNFKMKSLDKFNEDLHKKGIFDQIVDIIINDKEFLEHIFLGIKKVKGQVEKRMTKSFKRLFNECSEEGKKKLGDIIKNNLVFANYFDSNKYEENELYDNFKIDEILKDKKVENIDEILKYAFEHQRGNQLYIVSFFAQKKIEEKGFMEELEKNYGVYIDVDNFIKDMKQKLEEIKTYKDFYKYVRTDYGKEKEEIELIIEAYRKAKEKGYIRVRPFLDDSINTHSIISRELGRNFRDSRIIGSNNNFDEYIYHHHRRRRIRNRERRRSRSRSSSRSIRSSRSWSRRRSRSRNSSRSRSRFSRRDRSRSRTSNSRSSHHIRRASRFGRHRNIEYDRDRIREH